MAKCKRCGMVISDNAKFCPYCGCPSVEPLLKQMTQLLEKNKFSSASECCDKVLELDPECTEAFVGKLMAQLFVRNKKELSCLTEPFDRNENYMKALQYADDELRHELEEYNASIIERNKLARRDSLFAKTMNEKDDSILNAQALSVENIISKISEQKCDSETEKDRKTEETTRKAITGRNKPVVYIAIASVIALMVVIAWITGILPGMKRHSTRNFTKAAIGDYISFGTYEQDNDSTNGRERIEWQVLAKEDDRILVISRYAIECLPYHDRGKEITWDSCSLREWLNGTFFTTAFSSSEQERIQVTDIPAEESESIGATVGNPTSDRIFLLSKNEAEIYFKSDDDRVCTVTEYAESQSETMTGNTNSLTVCAWWLRSTGRILESSALVTTDGSINSSGYYVTSNSCSVRPAMWISIK